MDFPNNPSISLNSGFLSFIRKKMFVFFLVFWFVAVIGVISFLYLDIKTRLSVELSPNRPAELKIEKLNTDLFNKKIFLNLRTLAVTPTSAEYGQCLGVPGRPHIFTPFVPCQ